MNARVLDVASRTDPGLVRKVNEDAIGIDSGAGVVVLADGMAKRQGADVASRLAVRALLERLAGDAVRQARATASMRSAFDHADRAIGERIAREPALEGMGATAIAVRFKEGQLQVGHVGDARLYRLRGDCLERMTVDHSFLQAQLATGRVTADEARVSRSRHLVTRALGSGDQTHPDIAEHQVETGDLYLVCTDGLHELVDERDIGAALTALDPNAELAAETLVTMANDRGGTDNVSVIVVKIGAPESEPPGERGLGLFARVRAWLAK